MFKKLKLKKAILGCTTRWLSTYEMFERVLELKSFCHDMDINKLLNITDNDWQNFSSLKEVLHPVSVLNKVLQTAQLLAGDFLASWMKAKIEIKNQKNEYSIHMLNCLTDREKMVMSNPVFLSCIFLDLRYKNLLTANEKQIATDYIKKTHLKLKSINDVEIASTEISDGSTTEDELEKMLKSRDLDNSAASGSSSNFLNILAKYEKEPRMKNSENILGYWHKSSTDLGIVARNLLSLPVTQVSVERAFSGFSFIFNNYRTNLKPKRLKSFCFYDSISLNSIICNN